MDDDLDVDERIFRLPRSAETYLVLWLAGGIVAFTMAAGGFALAIYTQAGQFALQCMTTVPAMIGVGAFLAAYRTARTPREIGVGPDGVRVGRRRASQTYAWDEVGWSTIQTGALNQQRYLKVYDTRGKLLVQVSQAVKNFDELAELVAERVAARGDAVGARIQLGKARRMALLTAALAVLMISGSAMFAWGTVNSQREDRLLKEVAVEGEAQIEERFLAPNGITARLVYRITTPDGKSATRNAEVERLVWEALAHAKTVPVLYVRDEPSVSRLAFGERADKDSFNDPLLGYGMSALAAVIGLFCVAATIMFWLGWDFGTDAKTGRTGFKRYGT